MNIIIKSFQLFSINSNSITSSKAKKNLFKQIILLFLFINSFTNYKIYSSKAVIKYKNPNSDLLYCKYDKDIVVRNQPSSEVQKGQVEFNGQLLNVVEYYWNYQISNMNFMFYGCSNIIELDLSQFDVSSATEMTCMFRDCTSLVSINLQNFNAQRTERMGQMFFNCKSLVSLDLSTFRAPKAEYIDNMFRECSSLVSLDLSYINFRSVKNMGRMFQDCTSLVSINFSNFGINNIDWMDNVFLNCIKLQYINIPDLITATGTHVENIIDNISPNAIICLDQEKAYKIYNYFKNDQCKQKKCVQNYKDIQKKIIPGGSCVEDCISLGKYEYESTCYNKCPDGIALPHTDMFCRKCDTKCPWCGMLDTDENLCIACNKGFYEIYNETNINSTYKICYDSLDGYYLDKNDWFFKKCYNSCETCDIEGNNEIHNCIKCKDDFIYEMNISNYINCYLSCEYYSYKNINNNKLYCTLTQDCPNDYPKLSIPEKECLKDCSHIPEHKFEFRNKCYRDCPRGLTASKNVSDLCVPKYYYSLENKTQLIEDIQEYLIYAFDGSEVDIGKDLEIRGNGVYAEITTPYNQLLNINKNKTTVNLGKCENILRKTYNIYSKKNSFYILKLDVDQEYMKIPAVEYEVYYPVNDEEIINEKLNLSDCENNKVDITIPVELNDSLFIHNPKSDYYRSDCIKDITENGVDICLKDRKREFIDKNLTLCEENCDLVDYNNKKVTCNCNIKLNIPFIEEIKIDKDKLYNSFTNVKSYFSNINVVKCYKMVFRRKRLIINIGFFIFVFMLIFLFVTIFIFYCRSYFTIKQQIFSIIFAMKNNNKYNKGKITNNIKNNINYEGKTKLLNKNNNIQSKNVLNKIKLQLIDINNKDKAKTYKHFPPTKKLELEKVNTMKTKINKIINKNKITNDKIKQILEYNDTEKNNLAFEEALKYDKRAFFQFYLAQLKIKHSFLWSFFPNRDYNSRIIKIFLFFFFFSLDLTINTLFFTDETMHKIYEDQGKFDFLYNIPQIIFSSLISGIIRGFVSFMSLTEKIIVALKDKKKFDKFKINGNIKAIYNKLNFKFLFFFSVTFILLIIFGFYVSCFCGVYVNTQIHLIKDTSLSFGVSLIIPFLTNLLPGIFRIPSLKKKKRLMYKFSCLIEFIV